MTRYLRIKDGVVVNAEEWSKKPSEDGFVFLKAESQGNIGDLYNEASGEFHPAPPSPEARRLIAKSLVQERVNDIGKLEAVFTALNLQPIFFARWFAPDWPNVFADDEGLLAILNAVGCSPNEIAVITAPGSFV